MNRQIRRLGGAFIVMYLALFVQLNIVQVLRADEYSEHAANRRAILEDFNRNRGVIQTADGAVLARSVAGGRFERRREYPEGPLFAHVTGFFSFYFGTDGVERSYNDALAGRGLASRLESIDDLFADEKRSANVTLTIPRSVQAAAAAALGDREGAVVAVDPRTGAILALYSFPSYDPNAMVVEDQEEAQANRAALDPDNRRSPLRARSYKERYFPGSTFKIVTATAGLASGAITPEEPSYPPTDAYTPPLTNRPIRNFGGGTCGGPLFEVLRVSCNTAFAQMGVDIGPEAMVERAEAFGFNERPPFDVPAPVASVFPEVSFFDRNTPLLAQAAIGQNEVAATPLQMALAAAGIANGGMIMEPHVMAEIRDDRGDVVEQWEPTEWRRAMPPDIAAIMRDAMVEVVARGTARGLALPGIPVAGKTGTAQLGTEPPSSHAWIVGFAPADAPRVAVAVIVTGQPGASEQTGGRVAAPIARQVLEAALAAVPAEPPPDAPGGPPAGPGD